MFTVYILVRILNVYMILVFHYSFNYLFVPMYFVAYYTHSYISILLHIDDGHNYDPQAPSDILDCGVKMIVTEESIR